MKESKTDYESKTDNHAGLSLPNRKSTRLSYYDCNALGAYSITICVKNRALLLGNVENDSMMLNPAGEMIAKWWHKLSEKFGVELDQFVIMPNHFHGIFFIVGTTPRGCPPSSEKRQPLENREILFQSIGWFKTMTTNEYIQGVKEFNWPRFDGQLWQSRYHDHVIRDEDDLKRIREYILNNPLKWSLDQENPNRS